MSQSHKGSMQVKKERKAAMADARADHEAKLAMGLTAAMKQAIKGDVLLCTVCKITKMGPGGKCTCKGGATKPGPDYDATAELIAAAKARHTESKKVQQKESAKVQAEVASEREKKKTDAKLNPYGDLNAVLAALPCDVEEKFEKLRIVTFQSAKLGLTIEANTVSKPGKEGTQAHSLGVQPGWVISRVNADQVAADKAAILATVQKATAAGPTITFEFRVPNPGCYICMGCNIALKEERFNPVQLSPEGEFGPGKYKCKLCTGEETPKGPEEEEDFSNLDL